MFYAERSVLAIGVAFLLVVGTSFAAAEEESHHHHHRLLKPCRGARGRCHRRNTECCEGLSCTEVPRIVNKQRRTKLEQRCIDPTQPIPTYGSTRFGGCKAESSKCRYTTQCCEGLTCGEVDRYINKQGAKKKQKRCINPNLPTPIFGACGKRGDVCREGEGSPCCTGLTCSRLDGRRGNCMKLGEAGLRPFNREILQEYNRNDELAVDISLAADQLITQVVHENDDSHFRGGGIPEVDLAAPPGEDGGQEVGDEIDDFGTNNQEDKIEEGDVVVSDGTYVYAAYGDVLVIWDPRTMSIVQTLKMPGFEDTDDFRHLRKEEDFRKRHRNLLRKEQQRRRRQDIIGGRYIARPNIRHLVLSQDRLLVVLDGYQGIMQERKGIAGQTALHGFLATHLRLYAITGGGTVDFVKSTHVHGFFNELRVINGKAHVMCISGVNTWYYLVEPFQRWNFGDVTEEEYIAQVDAMRDEKIKAFREQLMAELLMQNGELPHLIRINSWQEQDAENVDIDRIIRGRFDVMESLAMIHSMDMMDDEEEEEIETSTSGVFMPGSWARFYGNAKTLIIAGQGWNAIPGEFWRTISTTYLIAFKVDEEEVATIPHSVGHADGYLLNNHAIDVVDNILRIGTSINQWWQIMPMPFEEVVDEENVVEGGEEGEEAIVAEPISRTENYVILLEMPGLEENEDGDEQPGIMEEVARLDLGLPNELFTALRFFDDVGYAVTFERTDPLYVIDFSKPKEPNVTAALKITGFSSYLHSMNDDNSLILAVGQEADDNGRVLGVALTVFDVTDLSNPKPAQRYVVEQDEFTYSYSEMENDFKSGRYVRAINRLVIPMNVWGNTAEDSFHGFLSFFVSENEIREECRITHGDEEVGFAGERCYYCAYFPPRSMIFDGNLMTVKDHFVKSTDMDTCEPASEVLEIVLEDDENCCGMWYDI